jgi:imidazole glycerol-phosphate synthase subunit HisH
VYIAIINYKMGNISSVENAFKKIGADDVRVTCSPGVINNAAAVVLPGVGAFRDAYENLEGMELIGTIKENISKKPFLGICLGMQLLFNYSLEDGKNAGLGILGGYVKKIPSVVKIPHIGWNKLEIIKKGSGLFSGIGKDEYFYFVHSYYAVTENKNIISCTTDYGTQLTAGVEYDNIYGLQFHPEKSSSSGLRILKNFWNMAMGKSL